MSDLDFILALMRQNTGAVGFIPSTTLQVRYIPRQQYIIQRDNRGRNVGYILTGSYVPGRLLHIQQAVIELDKRNRGFGETAIQTILDRAIQTNMRGIVLRCAEDLDSNQFWQALGFEHTNTVYPENRRRRALNIYTLDLWPLLWHSPAGAGE